MYKNIKWCIKCKTKIYINTLPPYKHDIQFNLRFTIIINKHLRFFMSVIFHICWNNYADITMLIFWHNSIDISCYGDITMLTLLRQDYYIDVLCWHNILWIQNKSNSSINQYTKYDNSPIRYNITNENHDNKKKYVVKIIINNWALFLPITANISWKSNKHLQSC